MLPWTGFTPAHAQLQGQLYPPLFEGTLVSMTNQATLALAEHDCAPWDGPAFGLWIPGDNLGGRAHSWIYLRIWQAPRLSLGEFRFPDQTVKPKGAVIFFLDLPSPRQINWSQQPRQKMTGTVRFSRVRDDENIIGSLDFVTEKNLHIRGPFEAKWIGAKRPC